MSPYRLFLSAVSLVGVFMLIMVLVDWQTGLLAQKHFPGFDHADRHHFLGLLLSLPVPLHVIFIGLILQKRWLSPGWARFAWLGIVTSGMWLGCALLFRLFQ